MKHIIFVLLLALVLGSVGGFMMWRQVLLLRSNRSLGQSIDGVLKSFQKSNKATKKVSWKEVESYFEDEELLQPDSILPQTAHYDLLLLKNLYLFVRNCKKSYLSLIRQDSLNPRELKVLAFEKWRCKFISSLPEEFFNEKPFMHPNGKSYTFLSGRTGSLPPEEPKFSPNKMHVMEIANSEFENSKIPKNLKWLRSISLQALHGFQNQDHLVLSPKKIFILSSDKKNTTYLMYHRNNFEKLIEAAGFTVISKNIHRFCPLERGQVCWDTSSDRTQKVLSQAAILWGSALSILGGLLLFMIYRRRKIKQSIERRRRFILQTLTHELRTPIASIAVSIDSLRKNFEQLSDSGQRSFLRICDDVQRLKRLTHASQNYLRNQ